MIEIDASDAAKVERLPDSRTAIVVLEGIGMYLTNGQLNCLFQKYKNPVNDVGVTELFGVDDVQTLLKGTNIKLKAEHSFTPEHLVNELKPSERAFFRLMFSGKLYRKIYRLYELEAL